MDESAHSNQSTVATEHHDNDNNLLEQIQMEALSHVLKDDDKNETTTTKDGIIKQQQQAAFGAGRRPKKSTSVVLQKDNKFRDAARAKNKKKRAESFAPTTTTTRTTTSQGTQQQQQSPPPTGNLKDNKFRVAARAKHKKKKRAESFAATTTSTSHRPGDLATAKLLRYASTGSLDSLNQVAKLNDDSNTTTRINNRRSLVRNEPILLKSEMDSDVGKQAANNNKSSSQKVDNSNSSVSTTSTLSLSKPGAFLMMGVNITGRAQVGMITPYNRSTSLEDNISNHHLLSEQENDDDEEQETTKARVSTKYSTATSTTATTTTTTTSHEAQFLENNHSNHVSNTRQQELHVISQEHDDQHIHSPPPETATAADAEQSSYSMDEISRAKNKKQVQCLTAAVSFFLFVAVVIVVILLPILLLRGVKNNDNNLTTTTSSPTTSPPPPPPPAIVKHWSDLLLECERSGDIVIDDSTTIAMTFQTLKQRFVGSDQQVQPCSPRHLALLSLSILNDTTTTTTTMDNNETDTTMMTPSLARYILSVLFFSLDGQAWNNNSQWLSSTNECTWFGTECSNINETSILTGLVLGKNNLAGALPSELYQLTSLTTLQLQSNRITGTLASMGISNMTNLEHVDLDNTFFAAPHPAELFALPRLSNLSLSQTAVPSVVPESHLGSLSSTLQSFYVSADVLGGTIPTAIGLLTRLTKLVFTGASLAAGQIPLELSRLTLLEHLFVNGVLTGTLPEDLFETNLNWKHLDLHANLLTGTIPTFIGLQEGLQTLVLSANRLGGMIPTELGNCTSMTTLTLSSNQFRGNIPTELGQMISLQRLKLEKNRFVTGMVPTELANVTNLDLISVDGCPRLSGPISPLFCEMSTTRNITLHTARRLVNVGCRPSEISRSCRQLSCCQIMISN